MPLPPEQVVPQIGYWVAECCVLDLYQVTTQAQLDDLMADLEDRWEKDGTNFGIMIWPTLAEAFAGLRDDGVEGEAAAWAKFGIDSATGNEVGK